MKKKNKIKIKLNGKNLSIDQNLTVSNLMKKLNIPLNKVAIELNKKIIDKKQLTKIALNNKDNLEIVQFIGGG
jgi:thiamine biosynthesis protein ThiS